MKRAVLVFSLLSLLLLILAFAAPALGKAEKRPASKLLSARTIDEIEELRISNQYDSYTVYQEEGGFIISGLPMENVNAEYLFMLLDESARVEYRELVTRMEQPAAAALAPFGLDAPLARVDIHYASGESLGLVFGSAEPVSGGQYFMALQSGGNEAVYLMDHSRVVRFLQPLKRFINFEIVPFRNFPSPLSSIKNLVLSGRAFPRPVVIREVRADNEAEMREAASFGAATHLIRSPHLHEIDQKEAVEVFGSLSGLLNIDVLDYNCDDAALAAYGFDDPLVTAEYDFQQDSNSEPLRIVLRAALYRGDYIVVRDGQRIVHRIEKEPFLATSYEKLAMRWFLTPFITDVRSIVVRNGEGERRFELSGEDNRSLAAELDGKALDMGLFRKFYTLLISASNDGLLLENIAPGKPPALSITFFYRDPLKAPDTMEFSPGSLRRLYVTVNGVTEFACLERYAQTLQTALAALAIGENFAVDW
jgi:hypothetical protein